MNLWALEFNAGIDDEDETLTDMPLAVCTSTDEAKLLAEKIHGSPLDWWTDDDMADSEEGIEKGLGIWWFASTNDSLCERTFEHTYINISDWCIRPCKLNQILRIEWNIKWEEIYKDEDRHLWLRQKDTMKADNQ